MVTGTFCQTGVSGSENLPAPVSAGLPETGETRRNSRNKAEPDETEVDITQTAARRILELISPAGRK